MQFLRRFVEKATRRLVFRRRLPARFGRLPFLATPAAALAYLRSMNSANWRELYDFADRCVEPGHTVWDVGANLGVFSLCAGHRAGPQGRVLAIEADPWLAALLQRSSRLAGRRAPIEVLCVAANRELDVLRFEIPEHTRSGSHLSSVPGAGAGLIGPTVETLSVMCISLDWLAERRPPPDVLKIDVEGAELLVLQGASRLLRTKRPKLLLEVYDAQADAVTDLLRQHRYELYDFTSGWDGRQRVNRATYNTLAQPVD